MGLVIYNAIYYLHGSNYRLRDGILIGLQEPERSGPRVCDAARSTGANRFALFDALPLYRRELISSLESCLGKTYLR